MKQEPRSLLHRGAGFAGIAGPVAFTVAWVTAALTLPGYSSRPEDISDLAAPTSDQPAIAIKVAGFVALGLGILMLAWGLWREFDGAGYRKVVPVLMAVIGAAVFLAGLFRSDCSEVEAPCWRRIAASDASIAHAVHNGLTAIIFALIVVTPALLTAALLALYLSGIVEDWNGVVQRLFVSVPLCWVAVLGGWLLRDRGQDATLAR